MNSVRSVVKLFLNLLVILGFILVSAFAIILIRGRARRRRAHTKTVSFFARLCCRCVNIKFKVTNQPPPGKNYLLVVNHIGFLDIFLMASLRPSLFITSVDMQETPGLGLLCDMGGCLYVERRNRSNIHGEISHIRDALREGNDIVLFPEAMATPGDKIYPFKKSLMTAAAGTGVPILPVVINYRKVNGEPVSDKWRDFISWHGKMSFFAITFRAYSLKSIEATVEFLEPIICENEEQRREVALRAQTQVQQRFIPIPFPTAQ